MNSPEKHISRVEQTHELEKAAAERSAELQKQREVYQDSNETEQQINNARHEANEISRPTEEYRPSTSERETPQALYEPEARQKSFKHTMKTIQNQMNPVERTFSKIIHNTTIEKISDTVGQTIARPTSILTGSATAFVLVLAVYSWARYFGVALSGFETIGAFIIGWVLGILFDLIRTVIKKRH